MNFADYQAIPAINATAIKAGRVSMKHMHHVMTGGAKETNQALRWGRIFHKAILEPVEFFAVACVYEGERRGKAWEAFKAEHDPEWILTKTDKRDEYAILKGMSESVQADPDARRMIGSAIKEHVVTWNDQAYGAAKARLDGLCAGADGLIELKTARTIRNDAFGRQFANIGYDLQTGWYATGAVYGEKVKPPVHVIAIEKEPPYCVGVFEVPGSVVEIGARRAAAIATAYRACEAAGIYPGPTTGITELIMPPYYADENEMSRLFAEASADALDL